MNSRPKIKELANLKNLLRHISLKHVKHQKAQSLIAMFGICLGVATMVSVDIVNTSVLRSFEDSINHVTGRAALQITGAESGFPEALLEQVQNVPGVEYAVPVIETNANLFGGSERSMMILGVDVLQDHQIRDYSITDETADIPDPLLFLARPDSILLTKSMADREGIKIDQEIRIQTVQGIKTFNVRGLLNPEGPARVAGGDIAIMDVYAAQLVFGKEGKIDRIDVSFLRGENLDAMKERIRKALPQGYDLDTPAARTRQVEILLQRYRSVMGLISFMAVFVGMYLIYNAVAISVVQRRKEIGILRALGTTRGEIIRLFLGETLVVSAIGSLMGLGLGHVFANMTIGIVAQSVTECYVKTSVTELSFSWPALIRNAGIGVLASLAAAAFPAVSSSRITPISAIRALPYSEDGFLFSRKIKAAAILFIFLSLVLLAAYKIADPSSPIRRPATTFGSMLFLILGISLFTPAFLKWFIDLSHRFLSSCPGAAGRLAGMNLQKNVSRNAVAVAAIFYGIAMFISSVNVIVSTKDSIFEWLDSMVRADILVSSGHLLATGGSPTIAMPGEMIKEFEEIPGVLSAESYRKGHVNYGGRRVLLEAFDVAMRMEYCPGMIVQGTRDDMVRLLPRQDYVAVNEGFAVQQGVKRGDTIILPTPDGPAPFGVAAVVVNYASDSGTIWIDSHTYQRHWRDTLVDMFELRVKPNEDIAAVSRAVVDRLGKERKVFTLAAGEFKDEVKKILERTFVHSNAVTFITLIIAGFGIVVTLLASVMERTREIAVLRSIGMKRSQVSGIVIIESALIGVAGGLLGAAAGILMGWLQLEGFIRMDLGASMVYRVHYPSLAWALLLAAGLSALAGLYPARRAAKTNIVEALAYE